MKFKLKLTRFSNGRRFRRGETYELAELGLKEPTLAMEPVDAAAHRAMKAYVAKLSPEERAARELQIKRDISAREPFNTDIPPERLVALPGWGVAKSYIEQQKIRWK